MVEKVQGEALSLILTPVLSLYRLCYSVLLVELGLSAGYLRSKRLRLIRRPLGRLCETKVIIVQSRLRASRIL